MIKKLREWWRQRELQLAVKGATTFAKLGVTVLTDLDLDQHMARGAAAINASLKHNLVSLTGLDLMRGRQFELTPQGRDVCVIHSARVSAGEWHSGQRRRYTEEPYINHPEEVAAIIAQTPGKTARDVAVALLHDTVEDCGVSVQRLVQQFGLEIAQGVEWLTDVYTDPRWGNRARRKQLERERIRNAPAWVLDIKLADMISNSSSIMKHDPGFATVYLKEKRALLCEESLLKQCNKQLQLRAWRAIEEDLEVLELYTGTRALEAVLPDGLGRQFLTLLTDDEARGWVEAIKEEGLSCAER